MFDVLLDAPPRIVLANAYPFAADESIPLSCSASEHIMVIMRGSGSIQIGSHRQAITPGMVAVAAWGQPWSFHSAARPALALLSVHLHFLPWSSPTPSELINWIHNRATGPAPPSTKVPLGNGVLALPEGNRVAELAQRAVEIWELRGDPRRELRLRGLALELVSELLPRTGRADARPRVSRAIRELLDWLRFVPLGSVTLTQLERRSGLGRSALGAAFRAATGLPPSAWLMHHRLTEADRLLRSTDLPINDIATRVGFADPFHFSRRYRQAFGRSPRQTRKG